VRIANGSDLLNDILVVLRQMSNTRQIPHGRLVPSFLDQEARGLILGEGEEEDKASKDNV
jgi:hypothetical protein